jgi:MFS family permease
MAPKIQPRTVIAFVNAAHFIDHYAMLVFAAAVLVMAPAFGMSYGQLLPYATPGFIAFGAGSLLTGWLGDRWSRRHMMVIFFLGIGSALVAVGLASTPTQLAAALLGVGLFGAIYHPVGTAMLVAHAQRLGRDIGINGVWGNLGVASSALVTGLTCQWLGWRWAFILPGVLAAALGVAFAARVPHQEPARKGAAAAPRVSRDVMWRVVASLLVTIVASSTIFNAVTVALPKLFSERLEALSGSPAIIGALAAGAYVFGALAQYTIGNLLDRRPLKSVFLPLSLVLAPLLFLAAGLHGAGLVATSIGVIVCIFGQVTLNDAMVGKYTNDEWRARAYSVRYFVGFTAAGASVGLVAWLHERGGFALMLQAFGVLALLVIVGAVIFPAERRAAMRTEPAQAMQGMI